MELLLILIFVVFVIFQLITKSPRYKGRAGEKKISSKLGKLINQLEGARIFHDLVLKTPDGSTQIDHLVLSTTGIFVIETKNMSGWIFGGDKQRRWTQTIYKRKSKFQNPIHQNYKHVKAVQSLLSTDLRVMFNLVVFVGDAKFKTSMPANVLKIKELLPYIHSKTQGLLSTKDIDRYASIIVRAITENPISEKEHLKNVRGRGSRKTPLCPQCGGQMVLRAARQGNRKGSKFWGCSKYPACRGTKNAG